MAVHAPSECFLLVGGKDLSGDTFQLEESVEQVLTQSNGFGDTFEEFLPIGAAKVTLSATGGFYDDRALGPNEAFQGMGATKQFVAYGMAGLAVGAPAVLLEGVFAAVFKRIVSLGDLTKANPDYIVHGKYRRSEVLLGLAVKTTDPFDTHATPSDRLLSSLVEAQLITSESLANPTVITTALPHGLITGDVVVISGSNSTPTVDGTRTATVTGLSTFTVPVNVTVAGTTGSFKKVTSTGAVVDLHVRELTLDGASGVRFTPAHSVDNVTYIPLGVAFADVTVAGTAQQQTIAGAVQRYVAIDGDFIGAPGANKRIVAYLAIAR